MSPAQSKVDGMTVFNTNEVNIKKQPMFFGQPLGVQRYDFFKYPVFDLSLIHISEPTRPS